MPLYAYRCTQCEHTVEVIQSCAQMMHDREKARCVACEAPMEALFPVPHVVTDSTFVANQQDAWHGQTNVFRKQQNEKARSLGINPDSHTYNPFFADKRGASDPGAWIPHDRARQSVRNQCERWEYASEGGVNHTPTVREVPDDPEPYTVAEDIVEREVEKVVAKEGGDVTPSERIELANQIRERASGS